MQRALMQYFIPSNYKLVAEALRKAGREDLIGWEKNCLIPPYLREKKKEGNGKNTLKKPDLQKKTERRSDRVPKHGGKNGPERSKKTGFGKNKR